MATGTFYLRPSADISLGHPVYPTSLTAGYLAINEEVSDGIATYIGYEKASSDYANTSQTSKFKMSLTGSGRITKVTSAKFCFDGEISHVGTSGMTSQFAQCDCTVSISGSVLFSGTINSHSDVEGTGVTSDTLTDADMPDLVTSINNFIGANGADSIPEVMTEVTTAIGDATAKSNYASAYVTQLCIELTCEYIPEMIMKVDGVWKPARKFFRKVSGVWTVLSADECKVLIQANKTIDKCNWKGHAEVALPGTATCQAEGMTGGKYCAFCGKTTKEHDTVQPIVDHVYNAQGGCRFGCGTTSPDRISFTIQRNTQTSANTYYAMPGVTWREYANDEGLFDYWRIGSNGAVHFYGTFGYHYTVDGVTADDLIIAGHAYTATDVTT